MATAFLPHDPDYAARVRASFERQAVMATLGVRLALIEPGRVVLRLPHAPHLTQQHGFVHAGIVATALDSACGYAASTLMPPEAGVLTIEFKINLLAPARGPFLRAEGLVTKAGRSISVADGRIVQSDDPNADDGKLVATMTATLMTVTGRDDVRH